MEAIHLINSQKSRTLLTNSPNTQQFLLTTTNHFQQLLNTDQNQQHTQVACHLFKHNLSIAAIASQDFEPAIAFDYLNAFWVLLSKYLNPNNSPSIHITPCLIQANCHLVHQLIHLTAPTKENPFGKNYSQPALIEEFIPTKTNYLSKLFSEATETLTKNQYRQKPTIFTSTIPWRPNALEYAKQEIWLDLLESISAILDPDGHVIKFQVVGMVDIQSKLSGLPDITLKFTDPTKMGKLGFHSCVRYTKWEKEKVVSFIPPDGRFRLLSYRSTPNSSSSSSSLPVTIKPTVTIGEQGGSFKLFITSLPSISHLVVRWQLGKLATGIVPEHLQCRARDGRLVLPAWEWDESNKEIRWSFKAEDANCCLTGLWRHSSKENTPNHTIAVEFQSRVGPPNLSFLGLKVEKIDINQHSTTTSHHHHHSSSSHYSADHKNTVASALAAPFISPAVAKGVKMKFKSSQYEIRW